MDMPMAEPMQMPCPMQMDYGCGGGNQMDYGMMMGGGGGGGYGGMGGGGGGYGGGMGGGGGGKRYRSAW